MNAALNSERWAVDQRRKARAAAAAAMQSVEDARREKIAGLQRLAGMMERLPAMAGTRAQLLDQIAQLQAGFATD